MSRRLHTEIFIFFTFPKIERKFLMVIRHFFSYFCISILKYMKENKIDVDLMLRTALDIGQNLWVYGADVRRVEDAVSRICKSYGGAHIEVFCTASLLQVSVRMPDGTYLQEMRKLKVSGNNLARLEELNDISRRICNKEITLNEAGSRIRKVKMIEPYRPLYYYIAAAFGAAAFCLFFGGTWHDSIAAVIAAVPITLFDRYVLLKGDMMARIMLEALTGGIFVLLTVLCGIGENVDLISIGVLMLLTPGIVFGNAIQDFLNGDVLAGLSSFVKAIIVSVMIAIGIGASYILWGRIV